jgi:hypothetical protein
VVIRFQLLSGADTKYRTVDDKYLDTCLSEAHSALCRAFSLDPVRTRIDAPSRRTAHRTWEALVLFNGDAIGRLFECRETDRYRDLDPTSERDAWGRQTK